MQDLAWQVAAMAGAYLVGSIPFGYLIGRAHGLDLRTVGSRNIGATNCGRVLGPQWGLLCLALDVLKGLLPVLLAGLGFGWLGRADLTAGQFWRWLAIGLMPMAGHIFPLWLGFRGGKGVATGLGVVLGIWPYLSLPGLAAMVTWLLFASCLGYVSLASVMAAALLPAWLVVAAVSAGWSMQRLWPLLVASSVMGLLVIVRHRSNLIRLWQGTEGRLGRPRRSGTPWPEGTTR